MPYGGKILALAEAVKPKYGGILLAVMSYGGNITAVGGFSFFGGNGFGGDGKIWRQTAILPLLLTNAVILRRENYRR